MSVVIKDGLGRNLYEINEFGEEVNHSRYYYESKNDSISPISIWSLIGIFVIFFDIGILVYKIIIQ